MIPDTINNDDEQNKADRQQIEINENEYKKIYVLPKIDTKEYIQYLDKLLYGDPNEKK